MAVIQNIKLLEQFDYFLFFPDLRTLYCPERPYSDLQFSDSPDKFWTVGNAWYEEELECIMKPTKILNWCHQKMTVMI